MPSVRRGAQSPGRRYFLRANIENPPANAIRQPLNLGPPLPSVLQLAQIRAKEAAGHTRVLQPAGRRGIQVGQRQGINRPCGTLIRASDHWRQVKMTPLELTVLRRIRRLLGGAEASPFPSLDSPKAA